MEEISSPWPLLSPGTTRAAADKNNNHFMWSRYRREMQACAAVVHSPATAELRRFSQTPPCRRPPSFFTLVQGLSCAQYSKVGYVMINNRGRFFKVNAHDNFSERQRSIAPVQFESAPGQLLCQILHSHPHLVAAAIDQQLEKLQSDKVSQTKESSPTSSDLYKRILEVKGKEMQRTLEEIIYCYIVHKFMENDVAMIPALQPSHDTIKIIDAWPNQEDKLQRVHSTDAFEMIQSHLALILGERVVGPLSTILQISKLKLGKLYAASIMYGYFLKRVDERFQLERTLQTFPPSRPKQQPLFDELRPNPFWDMESLVQIPSDDGDDADGEEEDDSNGLRSYVAYLDADTLQRYATIRSKEAISLIEKQTQALFGRPDIRVAEDGTLNPLNDEVMTITFSGLAMLVLEAAAFGSFLWDAEGYVEARCHFLKN